MAERENDAKRDDLIQGYDFRKTDLASSMKETLGNRFLGMDVDPATSRFLDFAFNQALPHIAVQIEEHGGKFLKDLLMSTGIEADEIKASEFGKKHAAKLAIAAVLAEPGLSVAAAAYDSANKLNNVRIGLTPNAKGNSTLTASAEALFGSNNEVVQNARTRIYNQLYTEIAGTLARSVVTLPALFAVKSRTQARIKSQTDEIDVNLAIKDPEKRKQYIREHMVKSGADVGKVLHEEKIKQIKEMRTEYEGEYKKFADGSEGKKVREEIAKRLQDDREYAQELGVGHIFYSRDNATGKYTSSKNVGKDELKKKSFLKDNPELSRAIDKELKYRFVEDVKHGEAFDDTWVKQDRSRYRRQDAGKGYTTVVDGLDKLYAQMQEQILGKQKAAEQELRGNSKDPSAVNLLDQGTMGLASIVGTQLHKILVGNKKEEYSKPVALDLILHMRKVIHEDKKEHREMDSIPNYGEKSGDSSFTQYVHKIFEQHQLDCKQSEVGSRYFDHFKQAEFSDDAVFKMDDKDLSAYEVAVKHIARAIKEGQMDSISLINLVGQRKIVQKDGKHFGPKGSNGVPSAIINEVNTQCAANSACGQISQEQLSGILSTIVFSEEEIKAGFAADGAFIGDEKSFLFMLLEAQIHDVEAMKKLTGLTTSEMDSLRVQASSKFNEHFDAAINAIASMDDKDVAALAKYDITADEIKLIRDAAESAQAGGKSVNDTVTGEEGKQLKSAVANVIMAEEKEDKNFWQNRVKAKASEALNSAVSDALQTEAPESATARLAHKRHQKRESPSNDHSLGTAP